MTGHIDPTKEVFARFRDNHREGPIHMLNLVRLRDRAAYPDGRIATGAEAYAAYGRDSGPVAAPQLRSAPGTKPTCRDVRVESAFGGKPDLTIATADFRV